MRKSVKAFWDICGSETQMCSASPWRTSPLVPMRAFKIYHHANCKPWEAVRKTTDCTNSACYIKFTTSYCSDSPPQTSLPYVTKGHCVYKCLSTNMISMPHKAIGFYSYFWDTQLHETPFMKNAAGYFSIL